VPGVVHVAAILDELANVVVAKNTRLADWNAWHDPALLP